MTVIASEFTATATRLSLDAGEEPTVTPTVALAGALVPHDRDV